MTSAGHCRGEAMAPVRQLVPSVCCHSSGNVQRYASCSHVVFPLQQVGSFPTASTGQSFGGGYHHLWRVDGGASVSSVPSSSLQRVIVMRASQEAGISTCTWSHLFQPLCLPCFCHGVGFLNCSLNSLGF